MNPTLITAQDSNRAPEASVRSPYFRRMMAYAWAYRKFLLLSFVAAVFFAALHAVSIGGVLPVLKVILEKEGLHGWIDRTVASKRLGLELRVRDDAPTGRERIVIDRISTKHPQYGQGLRAGDIIDTGERTAAAWLEEIAAADTATTIKLAVFERGDVTMHRRPERGPAATAETVAYSIEAYDLGVIERVMLQAGSLIDRQAAAQDKLHVLTYVLGFLCAAVIAANLFRFLAEYWVSIAVLRGMMALRTALYERVLRLPMSFFVQSNTADTVSRFVQDVQEIQRGLLALFGKVVREPLKAAFIFALALKMDWKITLTMLAVSPIAVAIFWVVGRKVKKANKRLLREYGSMIGHLTTTLQAIDVVKAYTSERVEQRRMLGIDRQIFKHQLKLAVLQALMSPVLEVLAVFGVAVVVVWLGGRVLRGELDASEFLQLSLVMGMLLDPLRKVADVYTRVQRSAAGAERIFTTLDTPPEACAPAPPGAMGKPSGLPVQGQEDTGKQSLPMAPGPQALACADAPRGLTPGGSGQVEPLKQCLEYREVTFTYPGSDAAALKSVNLTIQQGECVAIVGPNGSGKTTLVNMLLRFYDPNEGTVLYDGRSLSELDLAGLRANIALVTQRAVLFAATLAENIAYGRSDATSEQIEDAARRAFADEFISERKNGYQEMVGERGVTLSGGERQRVVIARAILRDAPILIFDEATSQVDTESDEKIHRAIRELARNRTTLMIAHRPSTIRFADRIVLMEAGRIIDTGTHDDLTQRSPLYRSLSQGDETNVETLKR